MPPRVVLLAEHGSVSRSGSRFSFEFEGAPLRELLAAAGRAFSALVACPEPDTRVFSMSFTAGTPEEALGRIAEAAGLRLCGNPGAWLLARPGGTRIPEAPGGEQALKGAFSGAKGIP
jgi:hypothetical protein